MADLAAVYIQRKSHRPSQLTYQPGWPLLNIYIYMIILARARYKIISMYKVTVHFCGYPRWNFESSGGHLMASKMAAITAWGPPVSKARGSLWALKPGWSLVASQDVSCGARSTGWQQIRTYLVVTAGLTYSIWGAYTQIETTCTIYIYIYTMCK